jgi:hypothetical protein
MGFSFRRKANGADQPAEAGEVHEVTTTGYEGDSAVAPDADLHLKRLKDQHRFDPYLQDEKLNAIDAAIETGDAEKENAIESSLIGENSPYAEVRNAVSPFPSARPIKDRAKLTCPARFLPLMTRSSPLIPSEPGPLVLSAAPLLPP